MNRTKPHGPGRSNPRTGCAYRGKQEPKEEAYSGLTMSEAITNRTTGNDVLPAQLGNRLSVEEIARRLDVGRMAVYAMLQQGILPGIRLDRRWIITRHAYEEWERTCGTHGGPGLDAQPEVTVVN